MKTSRSARLAISALAMLMAASAAAESAADPAEYFEARERGWFWYEDPPPPREEAREPASANRDPGADLVKRFEAYQEEVKRARYRAFLDPSPENVHAMARVQTAMVRRASEVADVWQRVIWSNPEFDFTLERPVNPLGLAAYQETKKSNALETLERMASSHVFYFFFKSDCPYCHAFAPILAGFSRLTGIQVFPVSLDGGGLPDFPEPRHDNGISRTLQVETVPALFLADPAAGSITPVSYGVLNEMELTDRIVALANPSSESVRAATPIRSFSGDLR